MKKFLFQKIFFQFRKPLLDKLRCLKTCVKIQEASLLRLVRHASKTQFGSDHHFSDIRSVADYQKAIPLRTYEDFFRDYFSPASERASERFKISYDPIRMAPYLENVTWPGLISFFSLSSGTTSGVTKFLPLTRELITSNYRAAMDITILHLTRHPATKILNGRTFFLGGSPALRSDWNGKVRSGDLSGVIARQLPWFVRDSYFPGKQIASIPDWEEKMKRAADQALKTNISVVGGVPSWVLLFLEKLNERVKIKGNIRKLWPSFGLFIHGGISFEPYRRQFEDWFGPEVYYQEVYPASEAFVAIEDPNDDALRLMVDYGTFYEFVPLEELGAKTPSRLTLADIQPGQNYAVVLTTHGGLWSYVLGDTIRFLSKEPPLLEITGRTKFYLSAFGEHLIQEEIEKSLENACQTCNALLMDYHVAPFFPTEKSAVGRHQFLIEFAKPPSDLKAFTRVYDETLQKFNEDYAAHRSGGFGLAEPEFVLAAQGFFKGWMKKEGKLGAQHKVPRISGDRHLMDDMLRFLAGRECF